MCFQELHTTLIAPGEMSPMKKRDTVRIPAVLQNKMLADEAAAHAAATAAAVADPTGDGHHLRRTSTGLKQRQQVMNAHLFCFLHVDWNLEAVFFRAGTAVGRS